MSQSNAFHVNDLRCLFLIVYKVKQRKANELQIDYVLFQLLDIEVRFTIKFGLEWNLIFLP